MARRGRPPRHKRPHVYNVKFVLYDGEDDDLIAYLDAAPPRRRASAVKTAMRSGNIDAGSVDDGDEEEMLVAFEQLLF